MNSTNKGVKNSLKDLIKKSNEEELSVSELLDVEGGVDSDLDDCIYQQCVSGAVKYCQSGA